MFSRNNCTYCGGGIEDNYPAAGADVSAHDIGNITIITIIISIIMIIIIIITVKVVTIILFFSDCSGGLLLPNRHHRLLHVEGEAMRQVQSKFLLKKAAHRDAIAQ